MCFVKPAGPTRVTPYAAVGPSSHQAGPARLPYQPTIHVPPAIAYGAVSGAAAAGKSSAAAPRRAAISVTSQLCAPARLASMRVLALTHGPLVRAENFGEIVRRQGHELVEWELPAQGLPPDDGFDAVMVFGGRMNV